MGVSMLPLTGDNPRDIINLSVHCFFLGPKGYVRKVRSGGECCSWSVGSLEEENGSAYP